MQLAWRIVLIVLVIGAAGFLIAFGVSRFLVGRLDGVGGGVRVGQHLMKYSSEDGYEFVYPDTYSLSSRTEGNAERTWDVLVLLPKGYTPPENGEGPPSISISVFPNPEKVTLEKWVRSDSRSNFKLSPDGGLAPTTVGGEPALYYEHSGLYETDATAVSYEGKIFLFEAGWRSGTDQIRADYQSILGTLQFSI